MESTLAAAAHLSRTRFRAVRDIFGRELPNNLRIVVKRDVLAEALWEYGEEDIAKQVLQTSDHDLDRILELTAWHRLNDPEPDDGPKLTNARIMARAAIEFFERRPRDTTRRRRRTRPASERYDAADTKHSAPPDTA